MAMEMGLPILSNMIMMGALLELNLLPLSVEEFTGVLSRNLPEKHLEINLKAIEEGRKTIGAS
jgi:Pyruvate/2-oxoacid:ferredoxin oxidoreductase gamma subunit